MRRDVLFAVGVAVPSRASVGDAEPDAGPAAELETVAAAELEAGVAAAAPDEPAAAEVATAPCPLAWPLPSPAQPAVNVTAVTAAATACVALPRFTVPGSASVIGSESPSGP